eukprot:2549199-Amphidinium_carterae.1
MYKSELPEDQTQDNKHTKLHKKRAHKPNLSQVRKFNPQHTRTCMYGFCFHGAAAVGVQEASFVGRDTLAIKIQAKKENDATHRMQWVISTLSDVLVSMKHKIAIETGGSE